MAHRYIEDLIRLCAHLTDEEIEGYVERSLDAHTLATVERHLRSCVHCRREVEILKKSLEDTDVFDDLNTSEDLVQRDVARTLAELEQPSSQVWIGDRSFPLEPSEEYPGLLKIKGKLVLAQFEDAIDEDRETRGTHTLRMEGGALNPIIVPMRDFKDVNDIYFEELKLVASTEKAESQATPGQLPELELVFVCHLPDRTLEIFSHKPSTVLFLRLT